MPKCPWCAKTVGHDYSQVGRGGRKYHPACREAKENGEKAPAKPPRKPRKADTFESSLARFLGL